MKKIMFLVAFLVFANVYFAQTNAPVKTETPPTDFLKRFIGTWKGEGKLMGLASKVVLTWENVLGGKFAKISIRSEMVRPDGVTQVFEGNGFYKASGEQKYKGNWFDSGGEAHPIDAMVEGSALNSLWGTEETKLGRTIYRLVDEQKMEVIDSIKLMDGSWREFGRALYVRKP